MAYEDLRQAATEWRAGQKARVALNNISKSYERRGLSIGVPIQEWVELLHRNEKGHSDGARIRAHAEDAEPWLARAVEWIDLTPGVDVALICLLGLVPPLIDFLNPAKLWKYVGLHVGPDGLAAKSPTCGPSCKGKGHAGPCVHFSPQLRAIAIKYVAEPAMRNPYWHPVYAERRAHTLVTHPEWALERNAAGVLTPKGHYHNDALRYLAKRMLREVWKAAHRSADVLVAA